MTWPALTQVVQIKALNAKYKSSNRNNAASSLNAITAFNQPIDVDMMREEKRLALQQLDMYSSHSTLQYGDNAGLALITMPHAGFFYSGQLAAMVANEVCALALATNKTVHLLWFLPRHAVFAIERAQLYANIRNVERDLWSRHALSPYTR